MDMTDLAVGAPELAAPAMIPVMKPWLGAAEAAAAADAVMSGWVAQGPRVAAFERALAQRVGAPHGVAVSSCTTGLHLALIAVGVGPGDEVVVPSLSFIATANVVKYVGADPVFADVELASLNLTVATVEAVLTDRTKAVILVHQAGMPADIVAMRALCEPRGIAIIEDAACAIGSTYEGQQIGVHSDLVVLSFHPRKVITTGEGGMIMTSRDDYAKQLRRLREHGMSVSAAERHSTTKVIFEEYLEVGYNYRMTDVQAAIGLVQLDKLDAIVARRREIANRYRAELSDIDGLLMHSDPTFGTTNYQSFWVLPADDSSVTQTEILEALLYQGVSARRGIMASHTEPAYREAVAGLSLPVTEKVTSRSVILPVFHQMTEGDQRRVISALRDVLQRPGG
jgi:dTDP-4-amino-4,6-dideoxygalactose transaminase